MRMTTLRARLLSLGLLFTLALAGCGGGEASPQPQPAAAQYKVHFAQYSSGLPILVQWRNHLVAEAKKNPDIELTVSDGQNNPSKLVADIEDAVTRKVNLIIIQAGDSQVPVPGVEGAAAAGIPVIAMQKRINSDKVTATYVGDDEEHGRLQAKAIVDTLTRRKGKPAGNLIFVNGVPGASITVDMNKGIKEVLSKYPDIKVVCDQPGAFRRDQGVQVLENCLQAHPDADGVWFIGADVGPGLVYAIEQAGKQKQLFVVGSGGYMEEIKLIMEDRVAVYDLVLPDGVKPALEGAAAILKGQKAAKDTKILGLEVTKTNAQQYHKQGPLAVEWPV